MVSGVLPTGKFEGRQQLRDAVFGQLSNANVCKYQRRRRSLVINGFVANLMDGLCVSRLVLAEEAVRLVPKQVWEQVGRPMAVHANALNDARQGQGRPRQARRGQVKPKSPNKATSGFKKARPGRPKEARRGLKGQAGEALKSETFFGQALRSRGGRSRTSFRTFGGEGSPHS